MAWILAGGYCGLLWLVFAKLRLIRMTLPIAIVAGSVGPSLILTLLFCAQYFHPFSATGLVLSKVIPITPQLREPGRVLSIEVQANEPIKKGDVLFRVDPIPYEISVKSLASELEVSKQNELFSVASVDTAIATIERAKANLAFATKDRDRNASLIATNSISQDDYERSLTRFVEAESTLTQANAGLVQSKLSVESAKQRTAQVEQKLKEAKYDLDQTKTPQVAGVLGVGYAPFSTQGVPKAGQPYSVRGIELGRGFTVDKIQRRQELLNDLEEGFRAYEKDSDLLRGLGRFSHRAHDIISSPRATLAFDVSREPRAVTQRFPDSQVGQGCLLAARLVEAGVKFVTVEHGGWDTHDHNFSQLKNKLLPELDGGLSGLLTTLDEKGLLETTTVFVTGEFGRTPKISKDRVGRDHYPRAMFCLLAGGGIQGGQVIGASDEYAEAPVDGKGIDPDDVAASFYHSLGIDAAKEYKTPTGRPISIVRNGTIIKELFYRDNRASLSLRLV